jgi:hypothetical protein
MSRMHRSIYFDVCCYIWDTNKPCPPVEQSLMLSDVRNWRELVDDLVASGKLTRHDDGSISNDKALAESGKAFDLWARKSAGGKAGKSGKSDDKTLPKSDANSQPIEPELEPEPELLGKTLTTAPLKRGTRIAEGWRPSLPYPVNVQKLVSEWPPDREERELDGFVAYWLNRSKNATCLNWDRTWHNRIRDQHDRIMADARRNGRPTTNGSGDGHGPTVRAALAFIADQERH